MAVVGSITSIPRDITRIRYPDIDFTGSMGSMGEIMEEPAAPATMVEDKMYVTVGTDVKESKLTLTWALHNSGGKKIYLVHVHQPAQKIPILGTALSISQLEEGQVRAYHELERQKMHTLLDKYSLICRQAGVQPEKLYIERDSIEKGIIELISKHHIAKLVMGAAADKRYSKKMTELKSKKAIYVQQQAAVFCHIWFVCKGNLIYTRNGRFIEVNEKVVYPSIQFSPSIGTGPSGMTKSQSVTEGRNNLSNLTDVAIEYRRVRSENTRLKTSSPLSNGSRMVTPYSGADSEEGLDQWEEISSIIPSDGARISECSSSELFDDSFSNSFFRTGSGSMNDEIYGRFEKFVVEAEISRREAYEESTRRRKAEKEAFEAICRAKTSEALHAEELRKRKEIEEALAKGKEEVGTMKLRLDEIRKELLSALEHKAELESQIAISERMVLEMEEKIFSAVELLQNYKKERDELQVERDNALSLAEELRKKQAEEASSRHVHQFFSEFSLSEIEEATHNFDPTLKIGEGGYGSIYKGFLRNTQVAIKMLSSNSLQGPSEFQQEVDILSKFRHPNIITLIGACSEAFILVYEYLPNGSLEDRLSCKDNTSPLSWQTRIRIAAELCSVLIFLHSSRPHSIVHGDLKPANILLDSNCSSKLSDFGICHVISQGLSSNSNTTLFCSTDPKGTFVYIDPEFLATGELTSKSDVYSFGIILLRLLTGRPALGITKEVQCALEKGKLKDLLDSTAGDWPFVQAKQLAHIAMRCCEMNRKGRPDLATDVWRVLESMRVSCGASSLWLGSDEHCRIPPYFICPIFQEIMRDPVIAADGFTYEAEALRGWLDGGHDTSPMTNLSLSHTGLVPNLALRSAIQEWLQQQQQP